MNSIERKITRLTFNKYGWVAPSGIERKSKVLGLHEADYGFGFEEWLFDFSKKINEYKYGFIEAMRTKNNKHGGCTYNLQLFTIDNVEKEKYWIGTIENCYVLTSEEQNKALKYFKRKGWLKEMEMQLKDINLWTSNAGRNLETVTPNVRFLEKDVNIFTSPLPVVHNKFIDNRDRYLLYNWDKQAEIHVRNERFFSFEPSRPGQDKKVERVRNSDFQNKEIKQIHRKLSNALYNTLRNEVDADCIACDLTNSDGTYIDMVKKEKDGFTLYEIKTYAQIKKNIREALGQLLEYAYWIRNKKIKQIVIVSEKKLDRKAEEYLSFLKHAFNIPISYLFQEIP